MASASQELIRTSYAERECFYEIDDSQDVLGQKNTDDKDYNRPKISQRDLGSLSVISSLTLVKYGQWQNEPACLVTFRFQFHHKHLQLLRFEEADISIEFKSRPIGAPETDPVVVDYGPKKLESSSTEETRKRHLRGTLSAQAKHFPVELGPKLDAGLETEYKRHYAAAVDTDDWGDRKHRKPNCIKCWVKEHAKQKDGVPIELRVAVIVSYGESMQATVDVRAGHMFHLLAWPWTADDPLLFQPGIEHGSLSKSNSSVDFANLTQDDWRSIVTPDLSFQSKLNYTA